MPTLADFCVRFPPVVIRPHLPSFPGGCEVAQNSLGVLKKVNLDLIILHLK